jgi:hypothetical protein
MAVGVSIELAKTYIKQGVHKIPIQLISNLLRKTVHSGRTRTSNISITSNLINKSEKELERKFQNHNNKISRNFMDIQRTRKWLNNVCNQILFVKLI